MALKTANHITLIGGLGGDPELKATAKGMAYCNFSLATTDGSKGHEKTNWHHITLWGAAAENAALYLKKGSRLYLEGTVTYNDWTDKYGQKRHDAQITAFKTIYLSTKGGGAQGKDELEPDFSIPF